MGAHNSGSFRAAPVAALTAVTAVTAGLLGGGSGASAAAPVTKHLSTVVAVAPQTARTVTVPYPDALEYGNAHYSGRVVVLAAAPSAAGGEPDLREVRIVYARAVLGGSEYQVRAYNGNPRGTAAVRLSVTTTTVEPLPHS